MSIFEKAKSGIKWTTSSTLIRAFAQLALLAIAARFLTGDELGSYALLMLFVGFAQLFMDLGMGNAVIHKEEVKQNDVNQLYVINFFVALLVATLMIAISPLAALFFEAERLQQLIICLSPAFLLSALFRMHLVVLQKQLMFNIISKVEIVGQLAGLIVAVYCLNAGYGVLSLVYGYLANLTVQALLFIVLSPAKIRPALPASYRSLSGYLSFGAYQTGDGVVNYINSHIDVVLVGKLLGTEVLGGYNLVRQFCMKPALVINPILTRVAFPVMSKLQKSPELPVIYTKLLTALAFVNFPIYCFLAFFSEEVVSFLFGEKWLHLSQLLTLLAVWCLVRSCMNPLGSLFMAIGKVKQLFKWNLGLLCVFPLAISTGAQFGGEEVAISLVFVQVVIFIAHLRILLSNHLGLNWWQLLKQLSLPLLISAVSLLLIWGIDQVFFDQNEHVLVLGGMYLVPVTLLLSFIVIKYRADFR